MAATDRTTRTPCGENTAAADGSAAAPATRRTDAPGADRPGSASRLSGCWAKWFTNTAKEPSWPAYPQRGGTSASCSCPLATNTLPSDATTDSGPRPRDSPSAWATTAMAVTGWGRLIASTDGSGALAGNQRVVPVVVMSPIGVPAAASCRASASGTSSLDTASGAAKYQVAC